MGNEATWARFYHRDGRLVLTFAELERQQGATERQRAENAEAELALLKTRLAKLEAGQPDSGA